MRPPTDSETAEALAFVERYFRSAVRVEECEVRRRLLAWQAYCQVVVASNEFLYVR